MQQPLEGIRVVDCGIYHAGPGGPAILGDLGAEVVKIEQPIIGDPIRNQNRIGRISMKLKDGRNLFNEGANRNKKSVTVNLKTIEGQKIVHRLVRRSDVFLTNMRPKAIESMNIGYPTLKEVNPTLIYATVSAFGPKGPDRDRGGFDYQGQARSGFMYSMGEENTPPMVSGFGILDQATAIMASYQIIIALYMRERFGTAQEVHVSILGTSTFLLYFNILMAQMGRFDPPRHDRLKENPLRNHYCCADEGWLMMTLTPENRHWGPLCRALEAPEIEHDPRFNHSDRRLENAALLISIFDKIFATRTRDEWLVKFAENDLFACAVNRLSDLEKDPQITENGYLTDFDHPALGKIKIPGFPIHFERNAAGTQSAAPYLGEHTDEILTTLGGFSPEEISSFKKMGIV
jgi:crotonobetainyl-CoA:carnitine CoA-transferase CaiB-like acyl-CoA transferase